MSCMPRTQDESSHPSADLAGLDEVWDARSKVTLIHCFRDEPNIWNVNVVYRSDSERRQALNEAWRRIEQRMTAMGFNFDLQQLKKKMKQLRDQFSRENKMFEDHSSKWQFYEEMRFLNQDEEQSSGFPVERSSFSSGPPLTVSPIIIANHFQGKGDSMLFDSRLNAADGHSLSLDVGVKSEEFEHEGEVCPRHGSEGSGAMVSSSGIILSELAMDELLRLVLSRKGILLSDTCDEETKNRSWRAIHDSMRAVTQQLPPVDELKEVFRRKQLHLSDIVCRHAKADVSSAHGFARYIQSIVNKCLPEDQFSIRERELGASILRKSFCPQETTHPFAKKSRLGEATGSEMQDHSRAETSASARTKQAEKNSPGGSSKGDICSCRVEADCLRNSLLEMVNTRLIVHG